MQGVFHPLSVKRFATGFAKLYIERMGSPLAHSWRNILLRLPTFKKAKRRRASPAYNNQAKVGAEAFRRTSLCSRHRVFLIFG